jgi:hypothetical protein
LNTLDVKYKVEADLADLGSDDFSEGAILSDNELLSYISGGSLGVADRAERQASFVEDILQELCKLGHLFKMVSCPQIRS